LRTELIAIARPAYRGGLSILFASLDYYFFLDFLPCLIPFSACRIIQEWTKTKRKEVIGMFYQTKARGEFVVGKGGVDCDMVFYVAVGDEEVVIARQDRFRGKPVKEETRKIPLPDFIDMVHRLWLGSEK
jgi:hypothetical protein